MWKMFVLLIKILCSREVMKTFGMRELKEISLIILCFVYRIGYWTESGFGTDICGMLTICFSIFSLIFDIFEGFRGELYILLSEYWETFFTLEETITKLSRIPKSFNLLTISREILILCSCTNWVTFLNKSFSFFGVNFLGYQIVVFNKTMWFKRCGVYDNHSSFLIVCEHI